MKIIADDKILGVTKLFGAYGEITYLPAEEITQESLKTADVLLIRTVTIVNADLLRHTPVKFVGTATTGTDHIDKFFLKKQGICFADAAGANAAAVCEYVSCCMAALRKRGILAQKTGVAGIIGCGRIGRLVAALFESLGYNVHCYDPLLQDKPRFSFTSFEKLMRSSDIITVHTPLTTMGRYPTYHMMNDAVLQTIKKEAVLINTARGAVIDQKAVLKRDDLCLCLDVWENEPIINLELLNKVTIGTPHIAGYSVAAKKRATEMLYNKAAAYFGWPEIQISSENKTRCDYDPWAHTMEFKRAFCGVGNREDVAEIFRNERQNYNLRHCE